MHGVVAVAVVGALVNRPCTPLVSSPTPRTGSTPISCRSEGFSRRELAQASVTALVAPLLLVPAGAMAESTLVTRQQAYTRYVPRIERGRDYWATGLRKSVSAGDWASIATALEKKGSIDRIFGPMSLWSSSWSGKTISEKTLEMNSAIDDLKLAAADLQVAADGKEAGGGGFFGFGGPKKLADADRRNLAEKAYAKGVKAINTYIELGNDGLGMSFSPIDPID